MLAAPQPWRAIAMLARASLSSTLPFALASLRRTKFPIPIGVFRAVEKPTYEALLSGQVAAARAKHGEGNLETLLDSGDTWTVEA